MHGTEQDGTFEELPETSRVKLRKLATQAWLPPMLATLAGEAFSRSGWLFEPKLDGVRCLGLRSGYQIQLLPRNQKSLNGKYPELLKALDNQHATSFAVDGEIVAFEDDITSFAKLQQRMQVQHPSDELRSRVPVWFYAFDLLSIEGYDTRQLPLIERRKLLAKSLQFEGPLRITEQRKTDGVAYFRQACRDGWEGIIAKDAESAYTSGRSGSWLKFKCLHEQEFVIGGYTDLKGSRAGFGALLVGYYETGKLLFAGRVGTGYDAHTLENLKNKLSKLGIKSSPFYGNGSSGRGVHWVRPKRIAQIGFAEWTRDAKLRQPRFLGLRFDKEATQVVREKQVEREK